MKYFQLEAAHEVRPVELRAADMMSGVEVDEANGVIKNCAVMTIGPALGYGWEIDATTLQQTQSLLAAKPNGVPVRFRHPSLDANGRPADGIGTDVGYVRNTRIVGNSIRGDVHLAEYAKSLPVLGNVWPYLLGKAKNDPAGIGLSAACALSLEPSPTGGNARLVARMKSIDAVDFVGKPAANPNGLLSEPNQPIQPAASAKGSTSSQGHSKMNPKKKQYLVSNHGLAPDATDESAQALYGSLTQSQKDACKAACGGMQMAAPAPVAMNLDAGATLVAAPDAIALEQARVTKIKQLAAIYPSLPENVVLSAIGSDSTPDQARQIFLRAIADANKPIANVQSGSITVGDDKGKAAYLAALPDAILLRAGASVEKPHELSQKLRGRKMIDMFRTLLVQMGVGFDEVMNINPLQMASYIARPDMLAQAYPQMYAQLAQSTDSFSNLLVDAMGKQLRKAYLDTPTTWQEWCGRDVAPDFKSKKFIALSDAPGLVLKTEGQEIKYSTFSDSKETATLATYASGIRLTREAIINDDLSAFSRIPMQQGGAAKRLEDDTAYAILTANANLADTGALFNSTAVTTAGGHANLISVTANVGAPTVTTLAATEALMLKQKGPQGAYLKLQARTLLVPVALKTVATKLVRSVTDPAATASGVVNPYYNSYNVISEPRLDANSAVAWYLAADPGVIDTVTMVFLTDEPEPVLAQETLFDTLDAKFAIRHTIVAKAIDFRGLAKNPGA